MTPLPDQLRDVLADATTQAATLRLHQQGGQAATLDLFRDRVAEIMAPLLDWLSEDEAQLRSGLDVGKLRAKFPGWAEAGLAKWDGSGRRARRLYCRLIVPSRPNLVAAYEAGRKAS